MTGTDPAPPWLATAACREPKPDGSRYTPDDFASPAAVEVEDNAKQICSSCAHINDCLLWAIEREHRARLQSRSQDTGNGNGSNWQRGQQEYDLTRIAS